MTPGSRVDQLVGHVIPALEGAPEKLLRQLTDLNLLENVKELNEQGYTIVKGALDPALALRVRDAVLSNTKRRGPLQQQGQDSQSSDGRTLRLDVDTCTEKEFEGFSYQPNLLFADPVFEEVLVCQKPLALITYLLGESCLLFSMGSHVKGPGGIELGLHSDTGNGIPEPFREIAEVANCNYVLTPYDAKEKGALGVVPGSHKLCRRPRAGETLASPEAIWVQADVGDCVVWHGNLWHGSFKREVPGLRLNLAAAYSRQYIATQEVRTSGIPADMRERHKDDQRFLTLLGENLGYGWHRDEEPKYANMAKKPVGLYD